MNCQTKGIVIALASAVAGGALPAAVSAQMTGSSGMALGLGVVALMNAVIAFIHISSPVAAHDAHQVARIADAPVNQVPMNSGNIELQAAGAPAPQIQTAQEPLNFPVMGWYALPEEFDDLPPEIPLKKPAKNRSAA